LLLRDFFFLDLSRLNDIEANRTNKTRKMTNKMAIMTEAPSNIPILKITFCFTKNSS
jgi:hypothetical protein